MYVDKEKPGWDCTATKPKSWKRIKEAHRDFSRQRHTEREMSFLGAVRIRFAVKLHSVNRQAGKSKVSLRQAMLKLETMAW